MIKNKGLSLIFAGWFIVFSDETEPAQSLPTRQRPHNTNGTDVGILEYFRQANPAAGLYSGSLSFGISCFKCFITGVAVMP